jgi:hypothetical protein
VSADGDSTILRNCGPTMDPNGCVPIGLAGLLPGIADDLGAQPYDGQFIGMVVEAVAIVP